MPYQYHSAASTSKSCTPMFNTIKELSKLDSEDKLNSLLLQMKVSLGSPDIPMSYYQLKTIIDYLNECLSDNIILSDLSESLSKKVFSQLQAGIIIDKNISNLARTIALVFEPNNQVFELVILTGRKFYNELLPAINTKYKDNEFNHVIGSGSYKVVKKAIKIKFENNKFVVELIACAKEKIARFNFINRAGTENYKEKVFLDFNNELLKADTKSQILNILSDVQENSEDSSDSLIVPFLYAAAQIKVIEKMLGSYNFLPLGLTKPCIKKNRYGEYNLKIHFFDNISKFGSLRHVINDVFSSSAPGCPYMLKGYKEKVDYWINIAAKTISQMHEKNVLHYDIKPENILLDDNWNPRFIDYGFSIDVTEIKTNTKKLLSMLGYLNPGDGYLEGYLLDQVSLDAALALVGHDLDHNGVGIHRYNNTPSFDDVNKHLKKYNWELEEFYLVATFQFASPEVFFESKEKYYSDDCLKYQCLGGSVVKMLSDKACKEISTDIDSRHDSWAFGLTVLSLFISLDSKNLDYQMAIIASNPVLDAVLHPDIDYRATIDEFRVLRRQYPKIISPNIEDVEFWKVSYEKKIRNLNNKLEDMSNLRQDIKNLIAKLDDDQFLKELIKDDALEEYVVKCLYFSANKTAKLLLPLIYKLLDKLGGWNTANIQLKLEKQISYLITSVWSGLGVIDFERLLYKSMVSGMSLIIIKRIITKLKNIEGWKNYPLWGNEVTIWKACLDGPVMAKFYKRYYLSSYLKMFDLEPRIIFESVIDSENESIRDCMVVLIMDKFLLSSSQHLNYDIFRFLSENPDYCEVVNQYAENLFDNGKFTSVYQFSDDVLHNCGIRPRYDIYESCLYSLKYAGDNNNIHYIIFFMKEFYCCWVDDVNLQNEIVEVILKIISNNICVESLLDYLDTIDDMCGFKDLLNHKIDGVSPYCSGNNSVLNNEIYRYARPGFNV